MKYYDILVYFDADYLCTGSFYDSFEYFILLLKQDINVGLVINVDEGNGTVFKAIKSKYTLQFSKIRKRIHIYHRALNQEIKEGARITFCPSMASACCIYNNNVKIRLDKLVTIMELPENHSWMKAYRNKKFNKKNTLILYDNRIFHPIDHYKSKIYFRTLFFDIMKQMKNPDSNIGMLNMVTNHKCYEPAEILKIIKKYDYITKWILFTKDSLWDKYHHLYYEAPNIKVHITPDYDYMSRFSHILYLPSKRRFDPSPRLIAEAVHFGKKFIYHDYDNAPNDGAYFRYLDVLNTYDLLKMGNDDPIIEILRKFAI